MKRLGVFILYIACTVAIVGSVGALIAFGRLAHALVILGD